MTDLATKARRKLKRQPPLTFDVLMHADPKALHRLAQWLGVSLTEDTSASARWMSAMRLACALEQGKSRTLR
jgi:hypothetical protein